MEQEITIIVRRHSAPTVLSAHRLHDEVDVTDAIRSEKKAEAAENDGVKNNTEGADAITKSVENMEDTATGAKKLVKEGEVLTEVRSRPSYIMQHPLIHFPFSTSYLPIYLSTS
jgi:hypothetical protein